MGINLNELFSALQTYLGSAYINDFNILGRTFRVNVQAKGEYRDTIESILRMKVKNNNGEMVPIEAFTTPIETSGPQLLTRYNMFPSVTMIGVIPPHRSSGEGIRKMEELSKSLPDGYSYEWTGLTYQEKQVGSQTAIFFAVSVLFTFLILAAQYESWSSPLIIMMAVPLGVTGSLLAVVLFAIATAGLPDNLFDGMSWLKVIMSAEINLYTQIGLLMMVGLSAKMRCLLRNLRETDGKRGADWFNRHTRRGGCGCVRFS
jgi:multidrug efflux pump subunit AcrB